MKGFTKAMKNESRSKRRSVVGRLLLAVLFSALPILVFAQERPSAFFVLIDRSASMTEKPSAAAATDWTDTKLVEVKRQLGSFCASLPAETDVRIWTFHEELFAGPELTITGEKDREQLRQFFAALEAPGKRTHLWSSLARVLEKASKAAEASPGRPVKVLIYSDNEDNESAGPGPEAVLSRYHDLIRERVQITYVSLGFTLKTDLKDTLERHAVRVRPSLSPADVIPLVPSFSWVPLRPTAGEAIQFVDHSGGVIQVYRWDFGDASERSIEKAPQHVYKDPGEYLVQLGLRSPTGDTVIERRKIRIAAPEPLKAAFKKPPATVPAGSPVYFVSESKGPIASFNWTFGNDGSSTEQHPVHTYIQPGVYTVRLTVTGTTGETDSFEIKNAIRVVGPEPPTVDFVSPERATAGDTVQFFARTQGLVDDLRWTVDDNFVSSEADLRHVFAQPGGHSVKLAARGPGGEKSKIRTIEVVAISAPSAALVIGATRPRAGDEVVFSDATDGLVNYVIWNFGEGEPLRVDYDEATTAGSRSVKHIYSKAGEFVVTLTAVGPGGESSAKQVVVVTTKWLPPVARFTANETTGRESLHVRFTNESEGTIYKYVWSFGDGSADVVQESVEDVEHTFAPGRHKVTLTVIGPEEFGQSRFSETITVHEPLPAWLKHLAWAVPAGIVVLVLAGVGYSKLQQARSLAELAKVSGVVSCKPSNDTSASWMTFPVAGDGESFAFIPGESHGDDGSATAHMVQAKLRVQVDEATRDPTYAIELYRNEELIESCPIEPDNDVRVGGFTFRYQP